MSESPKMQVSGSVMDGIVEKGVVDSPEKKSPTQYTVYPVRWVVLCIFVFYSASNSMQWIQYSIIQDAVVKYYGVTSITVYWTSMIYMITYIPLIFPGSWLLDKTVRINIFIVIHHHHQPTLVQCRQPPIAAEVTFLGCPCSSSTSDAFL